MSDLLIERCDFFVDTQVWSLSPRVDPTGWLSNFLPEEEKFARALLASFLFISDLMSDALLRGAFHNISNYIVIDADRTRQQMWEEFLDTCIFTTIDIDDPNITASGHFICRKAKQIFGLSENRFYNKIDALNILNSGKSKYVVFLDDIIGSGLQFTDTWTSPSRVNGRDLSYAKVCSRASIQAYYIPLVATEYGLGEIAKTCHNINILPGINVSDRYRVFDDNSLVWEDLGSKEGIAFLEAASRRAGIPNWEGFQRLGLTIAFAHSDPDFTLPIFFWKANRWKPLLSRS